MRTPWATEMPFTGIGLQPQTREYSIRFKSPSPARQIRFHTRGTVPTPVSIVADGIKTDFVGNIDNSGLAVIDLPDPASEFKIDFEGDKTTVYGGIELIADSVGTSVHSIGNNGATFSSYATTDRFGSGLSALSPDLVIIALGTNEAFGRISVETLQNNIDVLLSTIRAHSPEAKILLVGPTE